MKAIFVTLLLAALSPAQGALACHSSDARPIAEAAAIGALIRATGVSWATVLSYEEYRDVVWNYFVDVEGEVDGELKIFRIEVLIELGTCEVLTAQIVGTDP